ncbi:MAG: tetratricopeptide repeat protein [Bacteroidota bacterium]
MKSFDLRSTIVLSLMLCMAICFSACQKEAPKSDISALETQYREMTSGNIEGTNPQQIREVMVKLAAAYEGKAAGSADEAEAATYLFKAAEMYENSPADISKALGLFDQIIDKHPNHKRAADALFKKGFVFNNVLKDTARARGAYEAFIAQYPDHDMVEDAKIEVENLGLSAQELLEKIQKRAQEAVEQNSGS